MGTKDGSERAAAQLMAAGLNKLSNGTHCVKCGTADDKTRTITSRYNPSVTQEHQLQYNKATDTLRVTCCRCGYEWDRKPDDR